MLFIREHCASELGLDGKDFDDPVLFYRIGRQLVCSKSVSRLKYINSKQKHLTNYFFKFSAFV